jgi:hypothetical protein
MPTDLLGPPGRRSGCWPHDGEVDGGAVADFHFSDSGSGRRLSSGGRGERLLMSAGAGAARPTGSSTTIAKIPQH